MIGELAKLPAFVRRDLLVALSYRTGFVGDFAALGAQALIFYYLGRMVDPAVLPAYGGTRASYMQFAAVGIVMTMVCGIMLGRVAFAMRQEQLMGTLEALLVTPTRVATIQVGSAALELLWVPLRVFLFLLVIVIGFGLGFSVSGVLPATVLLVAFIPCVWGIGLVTAAAMLAFRRGAGVAGLVVTVLGLASGAYFPLAVLPGWISSLEPLNPLATTLDGIRRALLGQSVWEDVAHDLSIVLPASAFAMACGIVAFKLALARERRNGTLGLY